MPSNPSSQVCLWVDEMVLRSAWREPLRVRWLCSVRMARLCPRHIPGAHRPPSTPSLPRAGQQLDAPGRAHGGSSLGTNGHKPWAVVLARGLEARTDGTPARGYAGLAREGAAAAEAGPCPGHMSHNTDTLGSGRVCGSPGPGPGPARSTDAQGGAGLGEEPHLAAFLTGEHASRW